MRRTFLLDTNHLSAAINPVSTVRERLYQQHRQGIRLRTVLPVLFEIEVGIHCAKKAWERGKGCKKHFGNLS